MAKEDKKVVEEKKECECSCGCGCGCGCKCGCAKKVFKLIVLLVVFLAGIGCGCLICCCSGCKSNHRMHAPVPMAKHMGHQPRNNIIVIRTDGDEVVPEVAEDFKFHGKKVHHREHHQDLPVPPAEPAANEAPVQEPQA